MKTVGIQIRHYQPEDAEILANIYYHTIHHINQKDYTPEQIAAWAPKSTLNADHWKKKWLQSGPLVAVSHHQVVGFANFESNGHIDCFYIHHNSIGKGVGSALMLEIEKIASQKAIDRIYAEVSITAKPFFEAKGFQMIREQILTMNDVQLKHYKMEKYFSHQNRKVTLSPYHPEWPEQAKTEMKAIQHCLGAHCLEIHHIGSTAVPHLSAKNKIDLLCVVDQLNHSLSLEKIGYEFRGEWNVPLRYGFSQRASKLKVNLHVTEKEHGFIALNLHFRDYLRTHLSAREAYAKIKKEILQNPQMHQKAAGKFPNYTLAKNNFIKNLLKKSGYNKRHINFCTHDSEWQAYHRIQKTNFFEPFQIEYNQNADDMTDRNQYHFVLYHGINIVSCARVKTLNTSEATLWTLVTDQPFQQQGHGQYLLSWIEKWLQHHHYHFVKCYATPKTMAFYQSNGYLPMSLKEDCAFPNCISLGKFLDRER